MRSHRHREDDVVGREVDGRFQLVMKCSLLNQVSEEDSSALGYEPSHS